MAAASSAAACRVLCSALSRARLQRRLVASAASADDVHARGVHKQALQLTEPLYAYLVANAREPAALQRCRDATAQRSQAHMQVPPEQGAFLALLVELLGARRVLEVGTFTARSLTALASPC
jgi:hypothetical protein